VRVFRTEDALRRTARGRKLDDDSVELAVGVVDHVPVPAPSNQHRAVSTFKWALLRMGRPPPFASISSHTNVERSRYSWKVISLPIVRPPSPCSTAAPPYLHRATPAVLIPKRRRENGATTQLEFLGLYFCVLNALKYGPE
jgi:hypothetical protein